LLHGKDVSNTTINRVTEPGLGFISNGDNSLTPVMDREMQEEFRHIAGSEHLMYGREPGHPLLGAKIRGKYAVRCAFSPEKFACSAR